MDITTELNKIVESLCKKSDFFTFSVCNIAPYYGWSEIEYMYRDEIVQILRGKGYSVTEEVNHGVIDYRCKKKI